ncbi:hypothetical protein LTR50_005597 [Elasticomyces elasticus]|nr:hypothetical protein LTR50_005597 [Elasticomyces elasticus]
MEEKINKMEGEDESNEDDDGLDIAPTTVKGVNLDQYINDIVQVSSGDTENTESDADVPPRKKRAATPVQKKVTWSEDEEPQAVYNSFKNRKSLQRRKVIARTRKARANASESSMVGRRPHTTAKLKEDEVSKPVKNDTWASDPDNDLMEDTLPEEFKQRKSEWERNRTKLGEAGLQLPPTYDDVYFSDDERLEHLREKPVLPGVKPSSGYQDIELRYSAGIIPAPIAQWLRDYQVVGARTMHEWFVYQKGGILGDDMGLGKTIQVIAFLTAAFGKTGDERDAKRMRKVRRMPGGRWYPKVLIICPGGLMENWKSELQRWGWWQVDTFHGPSAARDAALEAATQGRLEIMITTYTTYRNHRSVINMVDWDCIVADECHQIKERHSETTKAMNEVNALCRIGLTGTAIQNNYEELWTLLNWTNPGRFGPISAWKASISEPLKMGQSHDATISQLAKARKTAKGLVENLLPSFFLRRMKSLIADQLPKKTDKVVFCPLTDIQAEAYANFVDSDLVDYIRTSSDPCDCNSGKKRGWCCYMDIPGRGKWQNHVFPCLVTLQKMANHLASLIPSGQDLKDKQDKDLDNLQIALPSMWKDLYRQRDSIINYANQDFCGKWKILKKLLRFWHDNGDKVLVFSHSVRLLKMLQMLFKSTTSYNVSYLDGAMSYLDRAKTVDEFNSDPQQFVFLISTKAGGVGLNITSANKVVVVDPNWNPAYDLQAQDRAYRIGQTRDVEVFRLVSAGTVEEIVYARQIYKQQQANIGYNASVERRYFQGVQDERGMQGEIFGLANLFAFQGDNVVMRDIVNKTNIAESKAGVRVVGLDMEASQDDEDDPFQGDREDAAMSQLAALVTGGGVGARAKAKVTGTKKTDAIQAILASAGVQYTHENSEVIGSSKVEAKISRRAEKTGNGIDHINEYAFGKSQSQVEVFSFRNGDLGGSEKSDGLGATRFRYRPPEHVRKRQFCTMAKHSDFSDATQFALVVEGWTQAQRRDCLDAFYRERRRMLRDGT